MRLYCISTRCCQYCACTYYTTTIQHRSVLACMHAVTLLLLQLQLTLPLLSCVLLMYTLCCVIAINRVNSYAHQIPVQETVTRSISVNVYHLLLLLKLLLVSLSQHSSLLLLQLRWNQVEAYTHIIVHTDTQCLLCSCAVRVYKQRYCCVLCTLAAKLNVQ
jgi:hypothetical protein